MCRRRKSTLPDVNIQIKCKPLSCFDIKKPFKIYFQDFYGVPHDIGFLNGDGSSDIELFEKELIEYIVCEIGEGPYIVDLDFREKIAKSINDYFKALYKCDMEFVVRYITKNSDIHITFIYK